MKVRNVMNQEIIDFIIEAKRKTYADDTSDCKVEWLIMELQLMNL